MFLTQRHRVTETPSYVANNHFSALSSCSQQQHLPPQDLHEPPHSHGEPFLMLRHTASAASASTNVNTTMEETLISAFNFKPKFVS